MRDESGKCEMNECDVQSFWNPLPVRWLRAARWLGWHLRARSVPIEPARTPAGTTAEGAR
jgi:hypothetical protein